MPDDLKTFVDLLTGERKPENEREENWLAFMGGVRGPADGWEKKWVVCTECGSEWQQTGMPASAGKWIYIPVCKPCRRKYAQAKPSKLAKGPLRERADIDN